MSIEEPSCGEEIQPSSAMIDQPPAQQMIKAPLSAPTTITITTAKSKENFYAKPGVSRCWHRSNE